MGDGTLTILFLLLGQFIFLILVVVVLPLWLINKSRTVPKPPKKPKPPTKFQKILTVILIAFMFIPCHTTYHGGTQEWRAVTYLVINWSKDDIHNQYTNSPQEGIQFYIFPYSLYSRMSLIHR